MLEIRDLCSSYSGKPVLNHVSLAAESGRITAILGPNGCGKSTLLKTICGIVPPVSGQVLLDGLDCTGLHPRDLARQISYLPQDRRIPDITAGRMVLHGRFPYLGYPKRYSPEDVRIASEAMQQMGISDLSDLPLVHLSGGERQKVYLAMALTQNTPVMLLDEPNTFLDIGHQLQLISLASTLAASGRHIIMVVHDLLSALRHADRIILMQNGNVCFSGTPEEVYVSGAAETVFGIRISRFDTPEGLQYYISAQE